MRWRNERKELHGQQQRSCTVCSLSTSQQPLLTLGTVRPSVKSSHAKWIATGSKRVLHVTRSLWALNSADIKETASLASL